MAWNMEATSFSFTPNPIDLGDLDHHYAYAWGLNSSSLRNELASGKVITSATLTFTAIWDWQVEPDYLYIDLLDNPQYRTSTSNPWSNLSGVRSVLENPSDSVSNGDFFAGPGTSKLRWLASTPITVWSDPIGGSGGQFATTQTFNLDLLGVLDELNMYAMDGRFGIGVDPECHYYNQDVQLQITTDTRLVPDGGSTAALTLGALFAVLGLRRNRRQ
jgi:hypothetical protein